MDDLDGKRESLLLVTAGVRTTVTVTTVAVLYYVLDGYREPLMLVPAGVGYSGYLGRLQRTVTSDHCWGRKPLLQWMSWMVTEKSYCSSLLG